MQDRPDPAAGEPAGAGPDRGPDRPGALGDGLGLDLVAGRLPDGPGHPGAEPASLLAALTIPSVPAAVMSPCHTHADRPQAGHLATLVHVFSDLLATPGTSLAVSVEGAQPEIGQASTVRSRSSGSPRTARRNMVCSAMAARAVAAVRGSTAAATRPAARLLDVAGDPGHELAADLVEDPA